MKAIISSKRLYHGILELFDTADNNTYMVYMGKNYIRFRDAVGNNVTIDCECESRGTVNFKFIEAKWTKIKEFLKEIPEQPIVIEIDERITISQFEIWF